MDIREFTQTEIGEINAYVINQVPQSILPQVFVLTEEPMKKTTIFNSIYRILCAARDFVETEETKKKMNIFLKEYADIYSELYILYLNYESASYNKNKIGVKIVKFYTDTEKNLVVNKLINLFLVFAEKQELLETEKVTGINLDSDEGKELHKKLVIGI